MIWAFVAFIAGYLFGKVFDWAMLTVEDWWRDMRNKK